MFFFVSFFQLFLFQFLLVLGVFSFLFGVGVVSFLEVSIQRIVEMGFIREEVVLELQRKNGDVDVVVVVLIVRLFKLLLLVKR